MAKRHPIDLKMSASCDATGCACLRMDAFKPGGLFCLQRVACRCENDKAVTYHVAFERSGEKLYLDTLVSSARKQVVRMHGTTYAPSDYGIVVDVESAGVNDVVEVYVFGYWTEIPE